MSNKTIEMTLLFDFFGDLLTEKQRDYFDLYYNDDLSLSEIAEQNGISRQGVRDLIVRAENTLRNFEEKTGVVERFSNMSKLIDELERDASNILNLTNNEQIQALANDMINKLQDLKG